MLIYSNKLFSNAPVVLVAFLVSACFILVPIAYGVGEQDQGLIAQLATSKSKKRQADIYFKLSDLYTKTKKYEKALEMYKKALDFDLSKKRKYGILKSMGDIYLAKQEYVTAINYFKNALEIKPNDKAVRLRLANAFELSELYDYAKEQYERVLKKDKKSFTANARLASLLFKRGFYSRALLYFNEAQKIKEDNEMLRQMAACYAKDGYEDLAIKVYEKILVTHQSYHDFIALGKMYEKKGQFARALSMYTNASTHDAKLPGAYLHLTTIYMKNGDYDTVEKVLSTAKENVPQEGLIYYYLAQVLYKRNRLDEARTALSKAKEYAKSDTLLMYCARFEKIIGK